MRAFIRRHARDRGKPLSDHDARILTDFAMELGNMATRKKADTVSKNVPAEVKDAPGSVPAFLQNKERSVRVGNIDSTDLIIPRIKLLQGISPEVEAFDSAKSGEFWHNLADVSMGPKLPFIPILTRKSLVLWAPRGDERGVLARSNDGIKWDRPDETFEVKIKNVKEKQVYRLGNSVKESGLGEFGSSIKGEPNSQPAAALTYNTLVYLPTMPESPLAILLNTRSSVKSAKLLLSKIEMTNFDPYALLFEASVRKDSGPSGEYNNYVYTRAGFANEEQYNYCAAKYKEFKDADFRASDEEDDDAADREPQTGGVTPNGKEKF